jgi:ATP-dependent protease ClpP protease subunit
MKEFKTINRGSNRLEVVAGAKETPQVILTGTVGQSFWDDSGITAKEVRSAFKTIPRGTKFEVIGSSEGGSVKEGLEIYDAIDERSEDITYRVAGYALSIASVFPLAASKVVSPKHAIWMIHEAHCLTAGNKRDKADDMKMLAEHDEMMAEIYAEKTGKPIEEIRAAMEAETWIRGSAAVDFGLADETDETDASASTYRPLPAAYLKRCKQPFACFEGGWFTDGRLVKIEDHIKFSPASGTQEGSAKNKPNSTAESGGAANDNMKAKIIALLKKHGVEVKDDWTDEQIQDALDKIPTAKLDTTDKSGKTVVLDPALSAQITAMQAQLAHEKKTRVTARINSFVDEQRLTNEEKEDALKRSMADETYLEVIAKRPQAVVGGTAVTGGIIVAGYANPLERMNKECKSAAERKAYMVANWDELQTDAALRTARNEVAGDIKVDYKRRLNTGGVQASNTYSATLNTSFLMDGAVTDLQNRWAALRAFTIDQGGPDPYKPKATGVLKHVTVGPTVQTNATNFELGDSTLTATSVTMAQYTGACNVSNADLQTGLRMENLVQITTAVFANKVIEVATVPITTVIFTNTPVIRAAELFSFTDLATLQASLKKSPIKNLILDGSYIARVANIPSFFQTAGVVGGDGGAWKPFGWDNVAQNTDWTGAGANVQGFACNPQAIVGIIGPPVAPANVPGGIMSQGMFIVPGLNIAVALYQWFNPSTRVQWFSYDVVAGFKEVDTSAGTLVVSA